MKAPAPVYEPRLILFLDILGFREIVAGTTEDPKALRSLLAAIDVISELSDDRADGKQVSQFSDSIAVSYPLNAQSAAFHLIHEVALTVLDITEAGFLLRGAITAGPLIHTARHLVGPALVDAYEMESKYAIYPRVLIDPIILEVARDFRSPDHSPEQEAAYVRAFMSKDPIDGRFYYDYVSFNSVVATAGGDAKQYGSYLSVIGRSIDRGLQHRHASVRAKYVWLHRQYLAAIDELVNVPADSPFRDENPGLCEDAERLPRLEDLAEAARRRGSVEGPMT